MRVDANVWGIVILLDHQDIQNLQSHQSTVLGALTGSGGVLTLGLIQAGIAAGKAGPIAGLIAASIVATLAVIVAVDTGNGSYVTVPWPTIVSGTPIVIPTSRPPQTLPPAASWASSANGSFGTTDPADKLSYAVTHNAVTPSIMKFRLQLGPQSSGWWKGIQLVDGILVQATGHGASSEGTSMAAPYADANARITFMKAKEFGIHKPVFRLAGLDALKGGDQVVFTWETD